MPDETPKVKKIPPAGNPTAQDGTLPPLPWSIIDAHEKLRDSEGETGAGDTPDERGEGEDDAKARSRDHAAAEDHPEPSRRQIAAANQAAPE